MKILAAHLLIGTVIGASLQGKPDISGDWMLGRRNESPPATVDARTAGAPFFRPQSGAP
jgi:hypothetical protein